jgi:hypothetical protein
MDIRKNTHRTKGVLTHVEDRPQLALSIVTGQYRAINTWWS